MATKKITPSKSVKKVVPAKKEVNKKAAPAKKAATTTKKAAPAKKAVAPAKKAAPAKKVAPAKKAAPAKKVVAPAKKAAPVKKVAAPTKKAAPAKKAAPVKKATAPTKKSVPAKKSAVAKKATVAKKVVAPAKKVAAPAKKAAPAPLKKATPAKKAAAPAKKVVASAKKVEVSKKESATKVSTPKATPTTKAPATKASSVKKAHYVAPPDNARADIRDAVKTKSKIEVKPGTVVAIRNFDKKIKSSEDNLATIEKFNPHGKSILDAPKPVEGPTFRYSDDELEEFKKLIIKRLESARENLAYYQALITRKDEAGTEDTDNRFNHMEDGSGAMEREQLAQLAARQIQFINHLEKALVRIENKTYGVCRVTGKLIDKARLRAVPHATLSIEAKTTMNK